MALDEPKLEDLVIDRESYNIVFDPQTIELIRESGGLSIDFVDEAHRKGFMVQLNSVGGGCDSGSCSC